jgi:endonuclease-3
VKNGAGGKAGAKGNKKARANGSRASRGARTKLAAAAVRAPELLRRLKTTYPDATCALDHQNAFQLIVATILSAQCTDARVNMVTRSLFARYPDAHALAAARQEDVEEIIRSTGFFRNKAKNLIAMAQALVARHGGEVPNTMDALHVLPGVGRKTANVVLGNAFGINEGVTVDTHVSRLSQLLQLTRNEDPVKIEEDLMPLFPREDWALLSHLLIFHGRQVCIARRPQCGGCVLVDLCPSVQL